MNYCKDCRYFVDEYMNVGALGPECTNHNLALLVDDPVYGLTQRRTSCFDVRKAGVECIYFELPERLPV